MVEKTSESATSRGATSGGAASGSAASGSARKRSNLTLWFAVALPLLAYVGSIGLAEAKRRGAPQIEVKIEGYDPRDLLRGQYLQYRIVADGRADGAMRDGGLAPWQQGDVYRGHACASQKSGRTWSVRVYDGARPAECQLDLPVDFINEAHRYYIQQDRGLKLEEAVREGRASVELRVVSPREVLVQNLLIDGAPIR